MVIGMIGGRYRLEGLLGEGGMARVFDAFDERLERQVAIKILRPETEALPGMHTRFQQEARIAARLVHPNIVAVLDYGEEGTSSYLVMERLPGWTLRDQIAQGPVPPARLVPVVTETLAALGAAHKFGVVHRDIKPSNILLKEDGHAKLTDFGIAKSFDSRATSHSLSQDLTMTGVVLGTPGYLAPERRSGDAAMIQSDLYAVGAVMVEALTGRRVVPGAEPGPEIPGSLRHVAARALAPDPRDRFGSADAMIAALRSPERLARTAPLLVASIPVTPATELPPDGTSARGGTAVLRSRAPRLQRAPRPRRRRLWLVLAALAALASVGLLVVFLADRNPPPAARSGATSHPTTSGREANQGHVPSTDPEVTSIRQLASSLADAGRPGDGALAAALDATAAQRPGPDRQAAADQTVALAEVLLAGGGITDAQYQGVVDVLGPTGATIPTTTTPTTIASPTAPTPSVGPPTSHGHGHDHGGGPGDFGGLGESDQG